jgi:hypothetical protein
MTSRIAWWTVGLLLAAAFFITLLKPPADVSRMLTMVSGQFKNYALLMHVVVLVAFILGLIIPKARNLFFAGIMALLAGSAAVIALLNFLLPNIIIFGLYLALILLAFFSNQLDWDFSRLKPVDWYVGIIGLVFGFWYLHWVDSPIMLNALLYSPLGVLNCPTMVTISGLLCLSSQRPAILDFTTGLVCTYFGFYGIILLSAYVDVTLVLCGGYQLYRVARQAREELAARRLRSPAS